LTKLAIVNESKRVTDGQVDQIIWALRIQMRDYCAKAGLRVANISRRRGVPVGSVPMLIVDNPDVAGALGYHDVDPRGMPYARVFVDPILDNGGSVLGDKGDASLSVSGCASHETGEWTYDDACNLWADDGNGLEWCRESGDPVQADAYRIDLAPGKRVWVSNLVLPAWFNPLNSTGPFDLMGKLTGPFTLSPGGYALQRSGGRIHQVFADGTLRAARDVTPNPARGSRTAIRRKQTTVGV
jgi:hypothetical protein